MLAFEFFLPLLLTAPLYIVPIWLFWRAVRAIEKIADKIERIADNTNARN